MSQFRIPTYRHHRPSGRAVVTLNGRDHYLGPWKSTASRVEYDRLIQEWLDNGRKIRSSGHAYDITITELASEYWKYAKEYYVKNGKPTGQVPGIKVSLRTLRETYGRKLVCEFGPRCLELLQQHTLSEDLSRRYINDNIDRIRRMFKWGVSKELVSVDVYQALTTVPGLRRGRSAVREMELIQPVTDQIIDVTLPQLSPTVADMVRFQRHTGCRPGEACIIRPCDVDTTDEIWTYCPESHKTQHLGRERLIFIGPKTQDVLRPYLLRDKATYCFSPAESEQKRNTQRHQRRKFPITPSQSKRHPRWRASEFVV